MSATLPELFRAMAPAGRQFAAGEFLFHRQDPVVSIYLVEEGHVVLLRRQPDGTPLVLQRADAGDFLAEASLFSAAYHCDAVAVRPTQVQAVQKAALLGAIADDRVFAQAWTAYLASEVQTARMRAELLSFRTVRERLDAWLAVRDKGLPDKGEWKLVAEEISVSPEALYRELARRRMS